MLKNLSGREKRLLAVTAAIVLGAVLYRWFFLPQLHELWALESRTAELQLQIIEMERALALGDRIERLYTDYEAVISQKGTDYEESSAFLRAVSDLMKANLMKPLDQKQPPTLPSRYYKIFALRLGVSTRPVWLARFLVSLERQKELIRVEDIAIKAMDDAENLNVGMKLTKVVASEERRQ